MNGERSTADHAEGSKPRWRGVAGMLRRMVVTLTAGGRWQLRGFAALRELVPDVEVFQGIGFWARPPAPANPRRPTVEAIVLNLGDSDAPIVVAIRDEQTRAAVAAALEADTTLVYNSAVRAELTPAGKIKLCTHGGTPAPFATLEDIEQLRRYVDRQFSSVGGHTHVVSGLATTTITTVGVAGTAPTVPAPAPVGTLIVEGE